MATRKKASKKKAVKKKAIKKKTVAKKTLKKMVKKKVATKKKVAPKAKVKAKPVKKPTKKAVKKKTVAKKVTKKKTTTTAKKVAKKKVSKTKASPSKTATSKKKVQTKKTSPVLEKARPVKQDLSKLDPSILKIRERLIANRIELLSLIQSSQSVERDVGDLTFSNEIDLASSLEGREMLFQLTSRDRNELKLIEEALVRISSGSYGECESCEKKISMKRLQIMPLTALCIECQEAAENL